MSGERIKDVSGFGLDRTFVCALVGNFSEDGADIVFRNLKAGSFHQDNIALDFCDRTIVKKQKPKGESYVR